MKRRKYLKTVGTGIAAVHLTPGLLNGAALKQSKIRLGGPVFDSYEGPDGWIQVVKRLNYRTANCPLKPGEDENVIRAYELAAQKNDIIIAEVGAWSNPISPIEEEAKAAIEKCISALQLADQIGARCCVNVSGSKNPDYWAGPHKDNFTDETFEQVVECTRKIIDAVKPTRTFFALEAMPWAFPDSADSYLKLLKAIDRKQFGVHLDPVNMITSPRDYFNNGDLIKEMFIKLGPHIRSCHAKDITLREDNYIPQLDELRAGLGSLNYGVFLRELAKLKDVPLIMEHLETAEEYKLAADHIRSVGQEMGIPV